MNTLCTQIINIIDLKNKDLFGTSCFPIRRGPGGLAHNTRKVLHLISPFFILPEPASHDFISPLSRYIFVNSWRYLLTGTCASFLILFFFTLNWILYLLFMHLAFAFPSPFDLFKYRENLDQILILSETRSSDLIISSILW